MDALQLIQQAGPRAVTPDLGPDLLREVAKSPSFRRIRDAMKNIAQMRWAKALNRQTALAKQNDQTTYKATNGLGTLVGRVDPEIYFRMRALHGDHCWDDPKFVKDFLTRHTECRVRTTRGTRGQEYSAAGRRR